jgi:hypothetical protein
MVGDVHDVVDPLAAEYALNPADDVARELDKIRARASLSLRAAGKKHCLIPHTSPHQKRPLIPCARDVV